MAWNKGEQGYRLEHSASELNEKLKALNITWDNDFEKGLAETLNWSKDWFLKHNVSK